MNVTINKKTRLKEIYFKEAVSGNCIKEKTEVEILIRNNQFEIHFNCMDNPHINDNTYIDDNSDLFKQEVFEVFISSGTNDPTDYLEIEINPNGAIFAAYIHNKDKKGSVLKAQMIEKASSGIISMVKKGTNSWKGVISIPLEVITRSKEYFPNDYRVNFYRIISQKQHLDTNWENSPEECIYACWKSTYSPQKPKFHRTKYFGRLYVEM